MVKTISTQRKSILNKHFLFNLTKVCLSGILLYWVLQQANLSEIFTAVRFANLPLLIGAVLVYFFSYYVRSHRWKILLNAHNIEATIPFLLKSYMVSIFFGNFLPSIVGGDVVRAHDSWRLGASKSSSAAIVLVDRFLGLVILLLFSVGVLLISGQQHASLASLYPWLLLASVILLSTIYIFLKYSKRIRKFLNKIIQPLSSKVQKNVNKIISAFLTFTDNKQAILKAFAVSVIVQITVISAYYLIAESLHFAIPFYTFFIIIPLATLVMMLPVSVNAIGLRENAFVFLLGAYGSISPSKAIAFSFLAYGIGLIQGLAGGIIYSLRK